MIIISDPTFEIQGCLCFPPKQYKHKKKYWYELLNSDQKFLKTLDIQTVQRCWLFFIICIFCAGEAVVKNYCAILLLCLYIIQKYNILTAPSAVILKVKFLKYLLCFAATLTNLHVPFNVIFLFNVISKWALLMTFFVTLRANFVNKKCLN